MGEKMNEKRTGVPACLLTIVIALALLGSATTSRNWQEAVAAELPAIQALEKAWMKARQDNTINSYKDYLAKYPNGDHAEEAKARIQIHQLNSGFGMALEFTDEQIRTYMERLETETYSTVIDKPLEYYVVQGDDRSRPTKSKIVVQPSPDQKACSLQLEAGNLSITAFYISASLNSPVTRPLFPNKWSSTMTHTGFAGPGLEIDLPSPQREEFRKFLDTFSIYYRVMHSTTGGTLGYVIPDLVWGSDQDATPHPHRGREFTIQHDNRAIVFKVDGVTGMPVTTITTYKQALALKTYLKMAGTK
jgi:hypothetical protein